MHSNTHQLDVHVVEWILIHYVIMYSKPHPIGEEFIPIWSRLSKLIFIYAIYQLILMINNYMHYRRHQMCGPDVNFTMDCLWNVGQVEMVALKF